jgi:hypothetical protein
MGASVGHRGLDLALAASGMNDAKTILVIDVVSSHWADPKIKWL